jgi:uncharacterized membrane protein
MLIAIWTFIYGVVVAASIIFIGSPSKVLGNLSPKTLLSLLLDWRFLLGGILALGARFIFVIINNLASKHANLSHAHLSITANHIFLNEKLAPIQIVGACVIMLGVFLVFR